MRERVGDPPALRSSSISFRAVASPPTLIRDRCSPAWEELTAACIAAYGSMQPAAVCFLAPGFWFFRGTECRALL